MNQLIINLTILFNNQSSFSSILLFILIFLFHYLIIVIKILHLKINKFNFIFIKLFIIFNLIITF